MNYRTKYMIGSSILLFMISLIFIWVVFCPYSPTTTNLSEKNFLPSPLHWFGTDELGRDLFARSVQGLQISFFIGFLAAAIDFTIGIVWGVLAAFSSRRIDNFLMLIADGIYSLPYLLVVILISVLIGTGILPLVISMVTMGWIQMARTTRILVKTSLHTEYVLAAKTLGASSFRLFLRHILPNIVGPILTAGMLSIPHAIFTEAFLSFLGIGIQPPTASLGSMISDALPAMRFYPCRLLFPACFISLLIFSIMLLADSLRDIYDPKACLNEKNIV
jgi:oligopeptide transport system permease protein